MRKVLIGGLLISIILIVLWQVNIWERAKNAPIIPSPQQESSEINSSPQSSGQNNTGQNNAEQNNPPKVFDILGTSNKLTSQQWKDMQEWRSNVKNFTVIHPQDVFINGQGSLPQVALTFDDGPDNVITPKVLDVLKQHQIHGTFFFVGNKVNNYSTVVKRALAEGNQVASHAYSHQELNKMNQADIKKEFVASDKALNQVLGLKPAMIRPPFGAINQDVLDVCKAEQEKIILWSIDTLDWSQPEPEHIAKNVLDNVRPGEIILMHSSQGHEATVNALPLIIKGLQQKGYQMVTLSELLKEAAYKN